MKSRKFFCNKTIIKNDLVRFWPLWGILIAGLQLLYTLPMVFYGLTYMKRHSWRGTQELLLQEGARKLYGVANPCVIAVFAILAAVLVFGYLFHKKEAYMLHSLPVNRKILFGSHFIAGLVMLLVPFLFTCLMVGGICGAFGGNLAEVMVGVLLEMVIMIVFFYAMACLVVMLCGNAAISIVIYLVANVLVAGMMLLVGQTSDLVLNDAVHSMSPSQMSDGLDNVITSATPVVRFREIMVSSGEAEVAGNLEEGFRLSYVVGRIWDDAVDGNQEELYNLPWEQVGAMAWYFIPAALFAVLAFYLYQKRALERVGDVLAFSWGKAVFHFVFSVCGSYIFILIMQFFARQLLMQYDATYRALFWEGMGCLLLGCILCFFISNMVLQKTFRIWKKISFVQLGICIVFALGMLAILRYDCYHGNLPDAKEVKRLEMKIDNGGEYSTGTIILERREDIGGILEALQKIYDRAEDVPMTEFGLEKHYSFHFDLGEERDLELELDCLGMDYFYKEYEKISSVIDVPETMIEKIFTRDYDQLGDDEFLIRMEDESEEFLDENEKRKEFNRVDSHKKELMQALQADLEMGEHAFGTMFQGDTSEEEGQFIRIILRPWENGKKDKSGKRYRPFYGNARIVLKRGGFPNFMKAYNEFCLDVDN